MLILKGLKCHKRKKTRLVIYSDVYSVIDKKLSCSNVGGRKGRNIRDHLLVIYGIINEVKNGPAEAIDVQG